MTKVADLSHGWSLWGDPVDGTPRLRRRDGAWREPFELVAEPDARILLREIKFVLDVMDHEWIGPGKELRWKAADLAKLSLEMILKNAGRFSDDLLDTGIGVNYVRV